MQFGLFDEESSVLISAGLGIKDYHVKLSE